MSNKRRVVRRAGAGSARNYSDEMPIRSLLTSNLQHYIVSMSSQQTKAGNHFETSTHSRVDALSLAGALLLHLYSLEVKGLQFFSSLFSQPTHRRVRASHRVNGAATRRDSFAVRNYHAHRAYPVTGNELNLGLLTFLTSLRSFVRRVIGCRPDEYRVGANGVE